MIVPSDQSAPSAPMPSETSLLMALADMHKQGRVPREPAPKPTNVLKLPKKAK
jgi:hypothetical protein